MHYLSRLRSAARSPLVANAGAMIGTTVVTAGLGFVYWWVAAQHFSPTAVGFASALISAMSLLGSLGMVGLGTLLIGELQRAPGERGSLLSTGLAVAALASAALGVLFALVAPLVSREFRPLAAGPGVALLFAGGVVLTAVTLVLDQALIGLMRGGLQLWRNGLFAVAKLVILLLLGLWAAGSDGMTIYTTWTVGNLVSLAGVVLFAGAGAWRGLSRPRWGLVRQLPGTALEHHALNLALQLPGLALPVVVTALLSTALNASFYLAWLTLHLVFAIPYTLTMVLYAAGMADRAAFAQKLRLTLTLATALGVLSCLVIWLGAEVILGIFGAQYAREASWPLRIMALGVFPLIIKDHFVAVRRVAGQIRPTAAAALLGSCLELLLAAIGAALGGLVGLSLGFVLALAIEAAFMGRAVWGAAVLRPGGLGSGDWGLGTGGSVS